MRLCIAIDEVQDEVNTNKRKVKDLCRTRWVQRVEALETFLLLYPAIVTCLENISSAGSNQWSTESSTDSKALLLSITSSDFICALVITSRCLAYTKALTISLQAEAGDVVTATHEICTVKSTLQDVRDNIDTYHSAWFEEAEKLHKSVSDEQLRMPRRCGFQRHRNNMPADSPVEYFRRSISIPLIDHMLDEFKTRFTHLHQQALGGLALVPSVLVNCDQDKAMSKFQELTSLYGVDLPSPDSATAEFHCWIVKWRQHHEKYGPTSLPTTPAMALQQASKLMFPNIRALLLNLCVLPPTSCSSERSFSALKRIKSALRTRMSNSRLSALTLMHIHRDIPINEMAIIEEFARRQPRRMELVDIFQD